MKTLLVTLLKLMLVAGLIYWLVSGGKLDFRQLRIFIDRPETLVYMGLVWGVCYLVLGAARWFMLMRALSITVEFVKVLRLQLIGFFFNTAIPGAVGGDIVKAIFIIRDQKASAKTPTLLTVLLDRVTGLIGLFFMAGVGVLANWELVRTNDAMRRLATVTGIGIVGVLVGFAIVFFPFKEGRDPIRKLLSMRLPVLPKVLGIYDALRSYRDKPAALFGAVGLSAVIQTGSLLFVLYLTVVLTGVTPPFATFMTIYPLGIITTAVPLAPGGLGVGHFAFEKLYAMVGLTGGANVFNVFVMGTLALNLLGLIPYLLHRSALPDASEIEKELATTQESPATYR